MFLVWRFQAMKDYSLALLYILGLNRMVFGSNVAFQIYRPNLMLIWKIFCSCSFALDLAFAAVVRVLT